MQRQRILDELYDYNPWWNGSTVTLPEPHVQRELYDTIRTQFTANTITGLVGLRRVGKTTLLKAIVADLLTDTAPERICYVSFDILEQLDQVLQAYTEEILQEPLNNLETPVYLLLDEVQKVPDWADHLKAMHDKGYDVHCLVSGSSSMNITKGAGESLAGRITIHKLHPFSFTEYLRYHDIPTDLAQPYPADAQRYRIQFQQYLSTGGLPELYDDATKDQLTQLLDLVFFRDIVEIFPVKRTTVLKGIFSVLTANTGQRVNYANLSSDLDTQHRTVKDYIDYLEDSFLIDQSPPHTGTRLASLRKNPKIYVTDHAYNKLYPTTEGLKAQTITYNHLKRDHDTPRFSPDPEVDIIVPGEHAFEVKYGNISRADCAALLDLPDGYERYLVTRDTYDTWTFDEHAVQLIPLWLLCLRNDIP